MNAGEVSIVEVKTPDRRGLVRREIWIARELKYVLPGDLIERPANQAGYRVERIKPAGSLSMRVTIPGWVLDDFMAAETVYWTLREGDVKHGPEVGLSNDEAPEKVLDMLDPQRYGWADKDQISFELMIPVKRVSHILRSLRREGKVELTSVRGARKWHRTDDCDPFLCQHPKGEA